MGLGYCWSLDFARPLPLIVWHNKYAFLDRVLSHFGAPTEVLTDQSTEFQGEFQVLCDKALIDHQTTSRDHPEADGLAKRVVQTVKGITQVWLAKGPPRRLRYLITMVGHGISIQSLGILGFLLTLFSIIQPRSRLANNDSS